MKQFDPTTDKLLTAQQVRSFDRWAIEQAQVPGVVLMENAGRSCAELIIEKLKAKQSPSVCIFCGTGNNGGDGFVIARHLRNAGIDVRIAVCGDEKKIKGDAKINLQIIKKMRIEKTQIDLAGDLQKQIEDYAAGCDLIVDAIFGTGLKGRLRPQYIELIKVINLFNKTVAAVDIPSGLSCDDGVVLGQAIRADFTITFVAAKTGFANPAAKKFTGQIYIASIGIQV